MEAQAVVGGRDDVAALGAPRLDDPVDGARIEVGAVGEHDDRRLRLRRERAEPAAQGGAGAVRPVRAAHRALVRLDVMRAEHDEDPVERRALVQRGEHARQQLDLLRRRDAVARRSAGRQHDGVDHTSTMPGTEARALRRGAELLGAAVFAHRRRSEGSQETWFPP